VKFEIKGPIPWSAQEKEENRGEMRSKKKMRLRKRKKRISRRKMREE